MANEGKNAQGANVNAVANETVNAVANETVNAVGSIKWFEALTKDHKPAKGSVVAVVSDCLEIAGNDFRATKYQVKLTFRVSTTNALGRTITSLRSGWLKDDLLMEVGEVVDLDLTTYVPVSNTYLTDTKTDRVVTNVETGEQKYLGSSLWFVNRAEAKDRFINGSLVKAANGMFAYKFDLPEGWIYGSNEQDSREGASAPFLINTQAYLTNVSTQESADDDGRSPSKHNV